jgi:hypothetical protein
MPKIYTKAQKAEYAKKMRGKRTAKSTAKKVVQKSVAKRIELKDRFQLNPHSHDMYENGVTGLQSDSVLAGIVNSHVIVPQMWEQSFSEGPANGQIIGTEIRPRYLNLKVKLNYDKLMKQVFQKGNTSGNYFNQTYHITLIQGWIKQDLREQLDGQAAGGGGWTLPAFSNSASYTGALNALINREMYNNELNPAFLTYRQKTASNIKVIKKMTIKGDLNSNFIGASNLNSTGTTGEWRTQDSNLTFNWDLSNLGKVKLTPIMDPTGVNQFCLGYNWVPFVQVRVDRGIEELIDGVDSTKGRSALNVEHVSHFTYSDS